MSSTTTPTACALTVVEALGGIILAKRWNADGTATPYGNARTVTLHAQPVANLAALADMLRGLLTVPRACIVRAEPIDPARTVRVRRLLHADPETGEAPTLREVPRRWVAVDLDSVPLPEGPDPRDLAACARAVRRYLPHAFRDAAAIVQATAGHGIKPGARLRWWAWLSRPVTGAELLEWFKASPVDPATFRGAQPIYTAAPLFASGMVDPIPERLALVPGARDVVPVPAPAMLRPVRVAPPPSRVGGLGLTSLRSLADRDRFAALVRFVGGAGEGERHGKLLWAARKAHELVKAGSITESAACDALVNAAMAAGGIDRRNAEKTAAYGLKHGPRGDA